MFEKLFILQYTIVVRLLAVVIIQSFVKNFEMHFVQETCK